MKNLINIELKKAICSKFFVLGLSLLLIFVIYSAIFMIENRVTYNPDGILQYYTDESGKFDVNPDLPIFSFYNSWIGGEVLSLGQPLFYNLLPIAAAIPFAWSYHTERKSGYLKNIASRTDKKKYFIAKTIAVFTSGALVVLIPLIANIILVSAFVPAIDPFAGYTFYNYRYIGEMWVDLYFNCPALYLALYVMLDAIYGGIYALLSFATAFYIKNILAVLFVPYFLVMAVGYLQSVINSNLQSSAKGFYVQYEFNPSVYLHSLMYGGHRLWFVIWGIALALLLFSIATIFIRGFNDEIF